MRLMQVKKGRVRQVVATEGGESFVVKGYATVYDLANAAIAKKTTIAAVVARAGKAGTADPAALLAAGRVLAPIDHPDPAHTYVTGTGLDHLGSAQARDAMHVKLAGAASELTDSMRMFKLGLEGGKPAPGQVGVQPEWFYKGDGSWLTRPGHPLELPDYALDGGEEPELVGLYVIGHDGAVLRVGFALGNEYSDHVLEKQNYLYLAHSKLRTSSYGPEILLGEAPADIQGTSRIVRDGKEFWAAPFLTGEANMTHTIANIEHHHFKYAHFRRPGDVHVHYFGTATLSFAAGIKVQAGDTFEISAPGFGAPLVNPLVAVASSQPGAVKILTL